MTKVKVFDKENALPKGFFSARRIDFTQHTSSSLQDIINEHCIRNGQPLVVSNINKVEGWDKRLFTLDKLKEYRGNTEITVKPVGRRPRTECLGDYIKSLQKKYNLNEHDLSVEGHPTSFNTSKDQDSRADQELQVDLDAKVDQELNQETKVDQVDLNVDQASKVHQDLVGDQNPLVGQDLKVDLDLKVDQGRSNPNISNSHISHQATIPQTLSANALDSITGDAGLNDSESSLSLISESSLSLISVSSLSDRASTSDSTISESTISESTLSEFDGIIDDDTGTNESYTDITSPESFISKEEYVLIDQHEFTFIEQQASTLHCADINMEPYSTESQGPDAQTMETYPVEHQTFSPQATDVGLETPRLPTGSAVKQQEFVAQAVNETSSVAQETFTAQVAGFIMETDSAEEMAATTNLDKIATKLCNAYGKLSTTIEASIVKQDKDIVQASNTAMETDYVEIQEPSAEVFNSTAKASIDKRKEHYAQVADITMEKSSVEHSEYTAGTTTMEVTTVYQQNSNDDYIDVVTVEVNQLSKQSSTPSGEASQIDTDTFKELDYPIDRIYAKDITCPDEYRDAMGDFIPEYLLPHGDNDLFSLLPDRFKAENFMCYLGQTDTGTPIHRDLCGTMGHNVMTMGSPDAYAEWYFVLNQDREKLASVIKPTSHENKATNRLDREVNTSKKSSFMESDRAWLSQRQVQRNDLKVQVVIQRPGDLVIVPSCTYHQVRNMGASLKVAWNRITPQTLDHAFKDQLPLYKIVCRPEVYKCKAIIRFALDTWCKSMAGIQSSYAEAINNLPAMKYGRDNFIKNSEKLLEIYLYKVLLPEMLYDEDVNGIKDDGEGEECTVKCDFCHCDIFHRYYHCAECDGYDICMNCYVVGRSCKHVTTMTMRQGPTPLEDLIRLYSDFIENVNRILGDVTMVDESIEVLNENVKPTIATVCRRIEKYRRAKGEDCNTLECSHCSKVRTVAELAGEGISLTSIFQRESCGNAKTEQVGNVFVCQSCTLECLTCEPLVESNDELADFDLVYYANPTNDERNWGAFFDFNVYQSCHYPEKFVNSAILAKPAKSAKPSKSSKSAKPAKSAESAKPNSTNSAMSQTDTQCNISQSTEMDSSKRAMSPESSTSQPAMLSESSAVHTQRNTSRTSKRNMPEPVMSPGSSISNIQRKTKRNMPKPVMSPESSISNTQRNSGRSLTGDIPKSVMSAESSALTTQRNTGRPTRKCKSIYATPSEPSISPAMPLSEPSILPTMSPSDTELMKTKRKRRDSDSSYEDLVASKRNNYQLQSSRVLRGNTASPSSPGLTEEFNPRRSNRLRNRSTEVIQSVKVDDVRSDELQTPSNASELAEEVHPRKRIGTGNAVREISQSVKAVHTSSDKLQINSSNAEQVRKRGRPRKVVAVKSEPVKAADGSSSSNNSVDRPAASSNSGKRKFDSTEETNGIKDKKRKH